ncbi:hypothetical protein PIIN_01576 [Serendipita indica DSM 11827]|uniref:Uncharacterized protein n=1 Tax=Serendipita indica (strain DSM 11827) TaxID=1109443 RepID=G4T8V0_SERID|nr:hypothetical protein PIIN_01576 [Serendipita indica DSM 11827]
MIFAWLRYFRSYRLFSSKPGTPIPKGIPGSRLATVLNNLGWTPDQPVFKFISERKISAHVTELYIHGENSSLQHEYAILRVDIHNEPSWLRIDWTGDVTRTTSFGSSEGKGALIWTISVDKDSLILPRDRQIRFTKVSVSLEAVAGMVIELSKTPYHLIFWNCIQFSQELGQQIVDAESTRAWQETIVQRSMEVAAGSMSITS